jgi:beta-glucosidase/6-phospho-beta-glucosidase/beta-galactosidase
MSKEIRQMIDKVKNFNQFVNEQYQSEKFILWENLPLSVKNDITENLRDNIKYLQSNYWNSESLRDAITDVIKQPKFKIEYKNVNELYNQLTQIGWGISEDNVKRLMQILQNNNELEPIILNNGKFFDGGHRLTAYKRLRKEMIPTIDIGFMLNFNWEMWDNGELDF